jgi:hypothetical protein
MRSHKYSKFRPSAANFKSFSRSQEQIFLTVGQNNFGNKIPFLRFSKETKKNCTPSKENFKEVVSYLVVGQSWLNVWRKIVILHAEIRKEIGCTGSQEKKSRLSDIIRYDLHLIQSVSWLKGLVADLVGSN